MRARSCIGPTTFPLRTLYTLVLTLCITSFAHHTIAHILPSSQIFVPRLRTKLVLHVRIRTPRHALPHPSRWLTSHIGVIEIGQPAHTFGLAVLFIHKFLLGKVGRSDSLPYTKTYAVNEREAKEELLDG